MPPRRSLRAVTSEVSADHSVVPPVPGAHFGRQGQAGGSFGLGEVGIGGARCYRGDDRQAEAVPLAFPLGEQRVEEGDVGSHDQQKDIVGGSAWSDIGTTR